MVTRAKDDNLQHINNLVELSVKLVESNRHNIYDLVYLFLKLVLILSVATTSVEIEFYYFVRYFIRSSNVL